METVQQIKDDLMDRTALANEKISQIQKACQHLNVISTEHHCWNNYDMADHTDHYCPTCTKHWSTDGVKPVYQIFGDRP